MGVRLDDMELIEDYARVILAARQKKGMSQDELAQKVGESISTLKAIEAGRQKPTEKTIRGLERELDISLLEPLGTVPIKTSTSQAGAGPTLGDRVVVKRKVSQKSRRESDT
jgi:putative transcription factor